MPILHIRNIPIDLYERIRSLAQARNRSLSVQVVTMLSEAVKRQENRISQANVLASIRRRRFISPTKTCSSLDLLREDRTR
jgi:plasmid stability protein